MINRRQLLTGVAAVAITPALPKPASAVTAQASEHTLDAMRYPVPMPPGTYHAKMLSAEFTGVERKVLSIVFDVEGQLMPTKMPLYRRAGNPFRDDNDFDDDE